MIINETSEDTRRIYVMSSRDGGISWSEPNEITKDVKKIIGLGMLLDLFMEYKFRTDLIVVE